MLSKENGFWYAYRRLKADPLNNWTAIKDDNGERILDPDAQKVEKNCRFILEVFIVPT